MINNETLEELFVRLMNRFENEDQLASNTNQVSKLGYTDEEIIFMGTCNLVVFTRKYPSLLAYYIECLS